MSTIDWFTSTPIGSMFHQWLCCGVGKSNPFTKSNVAVVIQLSSQDFEEGLYELLTYIDETKPDPITHWKNNFYDLSRGLFNRLIWGMDKSNDDPTDYPRPEDSYSDAEEARGECYMWHYAPVA